jgi:NADPH:quinone reductase
MRALRVNNPTGPDAVTLAEVQEPVADGRLLLDVHAAGVGFADLLMSRGEHPIRQEPPFTLGWEAAGVVVSAPPDSALSPGDEVVTLTLGAFAERISAVPETTFPLPDGLSLIEGAAFPVNYLTALAALQHRGRLKAGETALVHGAAGGVGSAAIQVARGLGGNVIAVVSTAQKAEVARRAGAQHVVVAADAPWRAQVHELAPDGVNVIVDPVGGDLILDSLRCLAAEGRLVVVGFAGGSIPQIPANRLLLKNVDVCGCSWSSLVGAPGGLQAAAEKLGALAAAGAIRPTIASELPLEQGAAALHTLERRKALGKGVLIVR